MNADNPNPESPPDAQWLVAGGAMGDQVRAHDWSNTPLGPLAAWPESLKIAVGICLSSRFPMFVWWGPHLINIYNDAYVPMLGKRHPAALGRPARDSWDDIWDVVGKQADLVMSRGEATWNQCVRLVMERKGYTEETFFTWSYSPIRDEAGQVRGLFCAVTEETDRVRAEDAVRQSEARFRALVTANSDVVYRMSPDWREMRRLEGQGFLADTDAPSTTWLDEYIHPDDQPLVLAAIDRAVRSRGVFELEHRVRRADGTVGWTSSRAVPLLDADGHITEWIGSASDITDRKRAQQDREQLLRAEQAARAEAERASRLKDDFLATLSHELRTPLNAIVGWSHLLERGRSDPRTLADGLAAIARDARAQTQMIEDLLDMSRIISGKLRLDVQPVSPATVVEAAIEAVNPSAQARGVRLERALDPAAGPLAGDPQRLQQAVWNLLTNAIKFTPAGGTVHVTLAQAGPNLQLTVTDTGQGIKPEFLPHLFERFRQADGSTTRRHGGLGIGLALVKEIVQLHGGDVRATSPGDGQGATFVVTLPLAARRLPPANTDHPTDRPPADDTRPLTPAAITGTIDLTNLKVLVVDDDPDSTMVARAVLANRGAAVTTATSATDALEALKRDRPDVLVSDIGMPVHDGYELIRWVRALPPAEGGRTPAVALTAFARSEDRRRALVAGFHSHVTKPVDPAELIAILASLTNRVGTTPAPQQP